MRYALTASAVTLKLCVINEASLAEPYSPGRVDSLLDTSYLSIKPASRKS